MCMGVHHPLPFLWRNDPINVHGCTSPPPLRLTKWSYQCAWVYITPSPSSDKMTLSMCMGVHHPLPFLWRNDPINVHGCTSPPPLPLTKWPYQCAWMHIIPSSSSDEMTLSMCMGVHHLLSRPITLSVRMYISPLWLNNPISVHGCLFRPN